ncbi:MAG: hypothetical protein OXI82_05225 [Nitrospinae bacterium]|nr:hypothetical protein [Nitrospinota bacterium]
MARHFILVLSAFLVLGCSFGSGGKIPPKIDHSRTTSFENGVLTISMTPFDNPDFRVLLSTRDDAESEFEFPTEMPGHVGRGWTLLQRGGGGEDPFMGYAIVSWNPDDPSDYLTAGWWFQFRNQQFPDVDPYHDDTLAFLFIDGPEIDPTLPPSLPAMGTASYSGGAGGQYLYKYGDNWPEDLKGKIASRELAGVMTLTADFAAGTIGGCLGCVGDLTVQQLHLKSAFDRFETEPVELLAHPRDYEVRFAPTEFNPDGTFQTGEGVTVTHPERSIAGIRRGYWGGGLSNRPDSAGNPRLVSGFSSVLFLEEDGSRVIISGIFNALSEDFRAANP